MKLKVKKVNLILALAALMPLFSFIPIIQEEKGEAARLIKLAREKEKEGKEHLALSYLTQALQQDPKNVEALEERGDIHVVLEDYDKAIQDYESALKLEEHEGLYFKLAVTHSDEGDDRECIYYVEKAMEFDFEKYEYYYYRGLAKMRMGRNAEAIIDFNKADQLHADDHNVYYHRGLVHMHMHHYKMAMNDFSRAIELFPTLADYYFERGQCNYKLEQFNEAIADYNKAIELGDDFDYYFARGMAYDNLRKFTEAEEDFKYFLKHNPNNSEAQYQFGLIEYHADKFANAEKLFNQVIESEPENSLAYFYRGMVRFKLDRKEEACEDFETCRKLGYIAGYNQMKANCKY